MILLETLAAWIEEANEPYSDSMALATSTKDGRPSVRTVSLRGIEAAGIRFFTGYESRKACELDENPHAAALFFFRSLRRQVRLEGTVRRLPDSINDDYFRSRPREHRISTSSWVQGRRIASIDDLQRTSEPPENRPPHWGGYLLEVQAGELWIGGEARMHERVRFENGERFRLAP